MQNFAKLFLLMYCCCLLIIYISPPACDIFQINVTRLFVRAWVMQSQRTALLKKHRTDDALSPTVWSRTRRRNDKIVHNDVIVFRSRLILIKLRLSDGCAPLFFCRLFGWFYLFVLSRQPPTKKGDVRQTVLRDAFSLNRL